MVVVGRSAEVAALSAHAARRTPVVSVCGPGGIGKTQLVRAALGDADGGLVVLAGETTATGVLRRIAEHVGAQLGGDDDAAASRRLGAVLAARAAPLILDDADDALEIVRGLVDLWTGAGVTGLVVTSRAALEAERGEVLRLEPLDECAAAELFLRRADRATSDDGPVTRELLAALGHNPLAIELAAGLSALASPRELLASLRRGLDLPDVTGAHGEAHASLERVVARSWAQLDDADRATLSGCLAFAGPFTALDAAEVLGAGALASLDRLRRRSLLERAVDGATPRLRPYAEVAACVRRWAPPGPAVEEGHARWAWGRAEPLRGRIAREGSTEALDQLSGLYPELRAAWRRMIGRDDALACRVALPAVGYLGYRHIGLALEACDELAGAVAALPPGERVHWTIAHCRAERRRGRAVQGLRRLDDAVAEAERGGAGVVAGMLRSERAAASYQASGGDAIGEARRAVEELGDGAPADARAYAWRVLGVALRLADREGDAAEALERARGLYRSSGHLHGEAMCLSQLAMLDMLPLATCERHVAEAEGLQRRLGPDPRLVAVLHTNLALRCLFVGEVERALPSVRVAAAQLRLDGDLAQAWNLESELAIATAAWGDLDLAASRLDAALLEARSLQAPRSEPGLHLARGVVAQLRGDLDAAQVAYERAEARGLDLGAHWITGYARDLRRLVAAERKGEVAPEAPSVSATAEGPGRLWTALVARAAAGGAKRRPRWSIARDGAWFVGPDGQRVALGRRVAARSLLEVLARTHGERPGRAVPPEELIAAGWPGERIRPDSARVRLHTAVRDLRALGLGPLLQTAGNGYRLDPDAEVVAVS